MPTVSNSHSTMVKDTGYISVVNGGDASMENKRHDLDIVSPSPLVSWHNRVGVVESERELFLLTPLPRSKLLTSSMPDTLRKLAEISTDKYSGVISTQPTPLSVSRSVHDLSDGADPKPPLNNLLKPPTTLAKYKSKSCLSKGLIDRSSQKNSICLATSISNTPFMTDQIIVDPATESIKLEKKCSSEVTHTQDDLKDMHAKVPLIKLPDVSKSVPEDLSGIRKVELPCTDAAKHHTKLTKSKSESWISSNFTSHSTRDNLIHLVTPISKTPFSQDGALNHSVTDSVYPKGKSISLVTDTQIDLESYADDSVEEVLDGFASRYGTIFDTQHTDKFVHNWREVDATLDWFLSPPKTCILLEPSDNKTLQMGHLLPTPGKGTLLATPLWSGFEGTLPKGKQCGETTLKKELWTRFDAASSIGPQLDTSVLHKSGRKGFLDLLEEASKEPNDFHTEAGR